MPSSASPEVIAASASSKVGQGMGSASGWASTIAMWELAPGSPWNAIFILLVMSVFLAGLLAAPQAFASAADLTFLHYPLLAPSGTSNRKAALELFSCWRPFVSEVRTEGAAMGYELRKRGASI